MRTALYLLLVLAVSACAPIHVRTDYQADAGQHIASWHTYTWLRPPKPGIHGPRPYTDVTHGRLQKAVDAALKERGYVKAPPGKPADFGVAWQGSVQHRLSLQTVNNYYGYGWRGWYAPGGPGHQTWVSYYDVGTLVLDLVDLRANQLMWRGIAQGELLHDRGPNARAKRLNKAVDKLLDHFPPP